MKVLMKPQIDTPSSRSPQHISLGDPCLAEKIWAYGRQSEGDGVPDSVAALLIEVIAKHHLAEGGFGVEVPESVQRSDTNVSGLHGSTIIASPERSKTR